MGSNIVRSFESFFRGWLIRQEQYLEQLEQEIGSNVSDTSAAEENEARRKELITRVLDHYGEYYEAKARVAQEDVFLLFSPPWFSSFERWYLWLAGFRPCLAFRIVSSYVLDLTEDQSQRINLLLEEIKGEVQELTDMLARVQRGMAAASAVVTLAEQLGHVRNGEMAHLDSTMDRFRVSMEGLVEIADYLRGKTSVKILEILSSSQALRFLAAAAQFQLSIRRYGQRRDAESQRPNIAQQNNSS